MVKKFSKIMEMNTGQRVVRINAYLGFVIRTKSFADRKLFTSDSRVLNVHQIFQNEVSCIIDVHDFSSDTIKLNFLNRISFFNDLNFELMKLRPQ